MSRGIAQKPLSVVLAQAVEVGGDTDTIASITGQIAGTASGVPSEYAGHFSRIAGGDEVIRVAESFADFLTRPKS
jgi:ADP-ribosylglycohydrolase